jgi:hypothetical protein
VQDYTQYFDQHGDLLIKFRDGIQNLPPYQTNIDHQSENDRAFIKTLDSLCGCDHFSEIMSDRGQWLVTRLVSGYNHLMPITPRDLLWFFGGDCLHYMPDEEIHFYQQLDELRFAAEDQQSPFDIAAAKAFLNQQQAAATSDGSPKE